MGAPVRQEAGIHEVRPVAGGADAGERRRFCPDRSVTRAEMAIFIIRAYPQPVKITHERASPPLRAAASAVDLHSNQLILPGIQPYDRRG